MKRTTSGDLIAQLKIWFSTFGVATFVRADNGPPFGSVKVKRFCEEYSIVLNLTALYHPHSLDAAERGVGLVKAIMKRTDEEKSSFEESFAAFKNTRNRMG